VRSLAKIPEANGLDGAVWNLEISPSKAERKVVKSKIS
jgi:hypothetical protein